VRLCIRPSPPRLCEREDDEREKPAHGGARQDHRSAVSRIETIEQRIQMEQLKKLLSLPFG